MVDIVRWQIRRILRVDDFVPDVARLSQSVARVLPLAEQGVTAHTQGNRVVQ
jgi:hypothetical protein